MKVIQPVIMFDETISSLPPGANAVVKGYRDGEKKYRKRLLAMGLTPGVHISVLKIAPMGDPVEIKVRDYSLTLRKLESDILIVVREV